MHVDLEQLRVSPTTSIREVVACINRNRKGIALVLGEDRRLAGTVTDGDIRRALLAGLDLASPVQTMLDGRAGTSYPEPVTAPQGTPLPELVHLMNERGVRQVPLLDAEGRVVDVALVEDLMREYELPLRAVVMAGGFGTRLQPFTNDLPKPMLPVGDKPILELIVDALHHSGVRKVQLTTHFKPEVIQEHFGDGARFGLDIQYVNEDQPLGTAGALGLVEPGDEPILLMNGDILTHVDLRTMLAFHREHAAELTVAVREYDLRVPYGVMTCNGVFVQKVEEKPVISYLVNAGIYLLEPSAHRSIPRGTRFDMTDLIQQLTREGRPVAAFPIVEYWLDIGQPDDYARAQEDLKNGTFRPR